MTLRPPPGGGRSGQRGAWTDLLLQERELPRERPSADPAAQEVDATPHRRAVIAEAVPLQHMRAGRLRPACELAHLAAGDVVYGDRHVLHGRAAHEVADRGR